MFTILLQSKENGLIENKTEREKIGFLAFVCRTNRPKIREGSIYKLSVSQGVLSFISTVYKINNTVI